MDVLKFMGESLCEGLIQKFVNANEDDLDKYKNFKSLDLDFHEYNFLKEGQEEVQAIEKLRKIIITGQKETAKKTLSKKEKVLKKELDKCKEVIEKFEIYENAADGSLEK